MTVYQVEVRLDDRRFDVFVVADDAETAEALAWAYDDHYEIVPGATIKLAMDASGLKSGVQEVLPVKVDAR